MATRKPRKAAPAAPSHPAILALRAAHAEYGATHETSSLFTSDLVSRRMRERAPNEPS